MKTLTEFLYRSLPRVALAESSAEGAEAAVQRVIADLTPADRLHLIADLMRGIPNAAMRSPTLTINHTPEAVQILRGAGALCLPPKLYPADANNPHARVHEEAKLMLPGLEVCAWFARRAVPADAALMFPVEAVPAAPVVE